MLESGWVDESRQNQVCNLPDMSHHRYNNLLWSDLVNACGFMSSEHLQGRYWIWVIFILAMFQVLWHRLRKPELVPLARKVNSWNCYGIFCIFNMVVVHEQVCWGIALIWMWMWILHVLCGLLSRMQCNRFYAGCESRRWAVLMNASWVDKPFRLPQYNEDLWDSHAS